MIAIVTYLPARKTIAFQIFVTWSALPIVAPTANFGHRIGYLKISEA